MRTREGQAQTYGIPPQMTVTFGSGDSDVLTYYNTMRFHCYQSNVGTSGQSDSGALTWNTNGTLQQLVIIHALPNGTDSQTCFHGNPSASVAGYDDLGRLISANGGSVWSQSFSYGPFGNISKSGSTQFQPVYNSARNRIISVGSTNASYDNNGNVLNDTIHQYTWDADGNSITVDNVGVTH